MTHPTKQNACHVAAVYQLDNGEFATIIVRHVDRTASMGIGKGANGTRCVNSDHANEGRAHLALEQHLKASGLLAKRLELPAFEYNAAGEPVGYKKNA